MKKEKKEIKESEISDVSGGIGPDTPACEKFEGRMPVFNPTCIACKHFIHGVGSPISFCKLND